MDDDHDRMVLGRLGDERRGVVVQEGARGLAGIDPALVVGVVEGEDRQRGPLVAGAQDDRPAVGREGAGAGHHQAGSAGGVDGLGQPLAFLVQRVVVRQHHPVDAGPRERLREPTRALQVDRRQSALDRLGGIEGAPPALGDRGLEVHQHEGARVRVPEPRDGREHPRVGGSGIVGRVHRVADRLAEEHVAGHPQRDRCGSVGLGARTSDLGPRSSELGPRVSDLGVGVGVGVGVTSRRRIATAEQAQQGEHRRPRSDPHPAKDGTAQGSSSITWTTFWAEAVAPSGVVIRASMRTSVSTTSSGPSMAKISWSPSRSQ